RPLPDTLAELYGTHQDQIPVYHRQLLRILVRRPAHPVDDGRKRVESLTEHQDGSLVFQTTIQGLEDSRLELREGMEHAGAPREHVIPDSPHVVGQRNE